MSGKSILLAAAGLLTVCPVIGAAPLDGPVSLNATAPEWKVVGVGIDPLNGRPWIVGRRDADGDGVADRWDAQRYNTATGDADLGGHTDLQAVDMVGGGGVDPTVLQIITWSQGSADTGGDGVPDLFRADRNNIAAGTSINFQVFDERYDTLARSAGRDSAGRVWAVARRSPTAPTWAEHFVCVRYLADGTENLGFIVDVSGAPQERYLDFEAVGVQPGTNQLVGIGHLDTDGDGVSNVIALRRFSNITGLDDFGFLVNAKYLEGRGVGFAPDGTAAWVCGPFDNDLDG
ncbi:MAG: hypothetical protein HY718_04555, partial [Planctomycetes bacterium]|nr:hypothetical protein [Planctomycetota bacterium]